MGPHPAVAAIRLAVRRVLHDVLTHHCTQDRHEPPLVLVACSGGADSMALASALAFEAPKLGVRAGGVTIDHGLQEGSTSAPPRSPSGCGACGWTPSRSSPST